MPLAILVRGADGPAPTACLFAIDACQITRTCKALPLNFRSRWRESLASRLGAGVKTACMGSFEVEESLSIGNGFVDHAKRIFQRC